MRIYYSLALGIGLGIAGTNGLHAQTLFTYGNNPVSKEEFIRVYQKNNAQKQPDFSDKSVREYIDLYSVFRMKVKEAEEMRLDTTTAVRNELENYKGQLSRSYLADKEAAKELVAQAYDRMKEEVEVQHILVALRPNEDSTVAYRKIDSIYTAISQGKADFNEMARQYSDDKGSAVKDGRIGYITALQVVYPFENAAYNTPVGQVSKPFRTQFGYHILKVNDRRPAKGQVQVAHLMIATPKSKGEAGVTEAEAKIKMIQDKLKAGTSFDDLVAEYSEDRFSKENKGLLEPFGVGRMAPEFENAAFALVKPGDISAPVKTEYGFHLIRLVKKMPLQPLDSIRENLTRRVENDGRSIVAKEAYQEKIKKQYKFKEYRDNFTTVVAAIPSDSLKEKGFKAVDFTSYTKPVIELDGRSYTQYDFVKYAADLTRGHIAGPKDNAFADLFKMYQNKLITDLQMSSLEKNNKEYNDLLTEYRDGTLFFDLMGKKVWERATKDTTGLDAFYTRNEAKYQWQPGFEGTVYQATDRAFLEQFEKDVNSGASLQDALGKINIPENPNRITDQSGRFEFKAFSLPASAYSEGKPTKVFTNTDGTATVVYVSKLHTQPENKTLNEARGFVVADYQDYLEKNWNDELKTKYPVKINDKTLKSITK